MASQADQKEEELLVRKEAVVDWGQSQWAA
jgi:hypothetical protein